MKKAWSRTLGLASVAAAALSTPSFGQGYGSSGYGSSGGAFNWSGWYVGANAGYGKRSDFSYPSDAYYNGLGVSFNGAGYSGSAGGGASNSRHDGFTGGVGIGYNYQIGRIVIGADYDFQYAKLGDSPARASTYFTAPGGAGGGIYGPGTTSYTALNYDPSDGDSNRWTGVARVKAGWAVDRMMFFMTGGAAYKFSYDYTDPYVVSSSGAVTYYNGYNKSNAWGWAVAPNTR